MSIRETSVNGYRVTHSESSLPFSSQNLEPGLTCNVHMASKSTAQLEHIGWNKELRLLTADLCASAIQVRWL